MQAKPFYRRHPLLCTLFLLLISAFALLVVALSQFDPGQLRQRLSQELSRIIQMPVSMERLHLTYQQGLAIDIHQLNIGDKTLIDVQIPQLTGVLRLKPLLQGELLIDRVILTEPLFKVALASIRETTNRKPLPSAAEELFSRFDLSLLTIRRGTLELKLEQNNNKIPSRIENLNLILRDWKTEQNGYLVVSGELPEQQGEFTVETELPQPAQLKNWRGHSLTIKADLNQLSRTLLPKNLSQHLPERIDATVEMSGVPATGADFFSHLTKSGTDKKHLTAAGRWISADQSDSLRDLRVSLYDVPLQGQLQGDRTEEGVLLQGRLQSENIALKPLLTRWGKPQLEKLVSGTLKAADVQFGGLISSHDGDANQPLEYHARLLLENGQWTVNETTQLEQIAIEVKLDNQTVELANGRAQLFDQQLFFQGEVHNWREAPLFNINLTAQPEVASLLESASVTLPEALTINGTTPLTLDLEGSHDQIRGELQLNLDELHGQYGQIISKQQGQNGNLQMKGDWQSGQVNIDQINLFFTDTHIEGTALLPTGEQPPPARLQLKGIDLSALRPQSAFLQRLKAEGILDIIYQHQGPGNFQGELNLENAGAHIIWLLSDINSTSGRVSFNQQGLDFEKLNVHVGQSALEIDGKLRDWKSFLLELKVRGQAVHARDLVFTNPEAIIRNIDGKLLINRGGIFFDPVHVLLANGTDATVNGYVRNFSEPDTFLDIESFQHADILEVINLFVGPPKNKAGKRTNKGKPIRVHARAAQGTLDGLIFQQAEGEITHHNGLFTLYPLRFKHKDGFCLSRVERDHGRLKISGHLEDFDASTLYLEVLKAQGLVTGTLRGDFYLEGNGTGTKFWTSSSGGAHLEIRDGALRKFRGLARVFSLLNVAQLFELKLPDMNKDGMPFNLLTTSVKLEEGLLSTTNLKIMSNAMNLSMIGQRNLSNNTVDLTLGVQPLGTVDKVITAIPVAGWLLAGEEKALVTAHFKIEGPEDDPDVTAIPVSSLSKTVLGVLKRTLGLPGTLITDPEKLFFPGRENPPVESDNKPQTGPGAQKEETDEVVE
ncbi:MAG TPA: AsmA-like C-terminal domain-containing protein [Geopsychrobacteraceae bacterium]|nr:AsmA-like C-terminal domain-containing protein [Geopsychrobacteraceae bacterium]